MNLLKLCLLVVVSLFSVLESENAAAVFSSGGETATICWNEYNGTYINEGWVITKRLSGFGDCDARFEVTKAPTNGSTINACDGSVIPSGYFTVGMGESDNCKMPGSFVAGGYKTIVYPTDGLYSKFVCINSQIPLGWVITGKHTSYCDPGDNYYPIITATRAVDWSYNVCTPVNVPPGYYIAAGSPTMCGQPGRVIKRDLRTGTLLCDHENIVIPDGYVITEWKSVTGCGPAGGVGSAYVITAYEHIQSSTVICSVPGVMVERVPDGHVITERGGYDICGPGTSQGGGYKISPLSSALTSMCAMTNAPEGALITRIESSDNCGIGTPRWYITRSVQAGPAYCAPSQVPAGWGYSSSGNYANCLGGLGFVLTPITTGSTICAGSSVPEGFVITRVHDNVSQCNWGVAYTLAVPSEHSAIAVCDPTTIPEGYVKTSVEDRSSILCGGQALYVIKKPNVNGETFVCGDSPIPTPYAISDEVSNVTTCGAITTGYQISLISGSGPYYLCDGSSIPDGYVVTARSDTYSHCSGSGYKIVRPNIYGENICVGSPVPADFVVVELLTSAACGTPSDAYRIRHPNNPGRTTICNVSGVPIPSGYIKFGGGSSPSCSPVSSSEIAPQTDLFPSTFIDVEPDVGEGDIKPVIIECKNGNNGFALTANRNNTLCQ